MSIKNKTRKTTFPNRAIEAKSFLQRTFGLLLYKEPVVMILRTRFGIHTFFMHYSIDVVVLDKNYRVVALCQFLRPWRVFLWNPHYDFVIELPEGTIEATKTKLGDVFLLT